MAKFPLGQVVVTKGVLAKVSEVEQFWALNRHAQGDWGDVCEEDAKENEFALTKGLRLLSVYHTKDGVKFYILTEADRSSTTLLLPEEY